MRIRPLAYFILLILNIYTLIVQFQLYQSPLETINFPQLGYYNLSKTVFIIVLAGSTIMLPYMAALLIGALVEAKWLYTTRLYCSISAITVLICKAIFKVIPSFLEVPLQFAAVDVTFLYLLAEGIVTVLEVLKRG
jgi:hypothetical protein